MCMRDVISVDDALNIGKNICIFIADSRLLLAGAHGNRRRMDQTILMRCWRRYKTKTRIGNSDCATEVRLKIKLV